MFTEDQSIENSCESKAFPGNALQGITPEIPLKAFDCNPDRLTFRWK